MTDLFEDPFDELWEIYRLLGPRGRSKKGDSRIMFAAIIGKGLKSKIAGTDLDRFVRAAPQEVIDGAKALSITTSDTGQTFVQGLTLWLQRAGWEDFDDEVEDLVRRYDERKTATERKGVTMVINPGPHRGSRLKIVD